MEEWWGSLNANTSHDGDIKMKQRAERGLKRGGIQMNEWMHLLYKDINVVNYEGSVKRFNSSFDYRVEQELKCRVYYGFGRWQVSASPE